MTPTLIGVSVSFLVLAVVFSLLEILWPAIPEKPRWRKDSRLDLLYWFVTPLLTRTISRGVALVTIVVVTLLIGRSVDPSIADGFGPIPTQPRWLVVVEMFLLADLLGYWCHRLFHGRRLWRFHAVHHSSTQVDWLSSVRLHPVNDIVTRSLQVIPLVLLGFPLKALAVLVPFIGLHALLLHANVPWTFGPLRYVISSPVFHRWHHTTASEAMNRNFAGFFPLWDLVFGTFHMPADRQPADFGIAGSDVPAGFAGQMLYPFRRRRASE